MSHQLALGYRGIDASPGSTQLHKIRMAVSITEGLNVSDVPQEHSGGGLTLQENQGWEPDTGSDPGHMAPLPCTAHLPG